jgi:2-oxoisovalerate dehydrogenase E1 component
MFTNRKRDRYAEGEPWVLQKKEESRLAQTQAKFRYAFDAQGKPHPKLKTLTYAEALFEAMMEGFYETRRWWPMARKTATGAARSASTAG